MRERTRALVVAAVTSPWLLDVAIAIALAALNVTTSLAPDAAEYEYRQPQLILQISVMASSGLVLIWRRDAPIVITLLVIAIFSLVTLAEWQPGSIAVSVMLAMYTVGANASRRAGLTCALLFVAVCVLFSILGKPFFDGLISLVAVPVFVAPWFVGRVALIYREATERERARVIALERNQAIEAERAVHEERRRIARELHDVISHTLTVISVQSGVARHLVGNDNPAAGALGVIEESSRSALDDLRRMLGVLRDCDDSASLAPAPGIDELQLLVAAHRASHGPVELTVDTGAASVPESLRLTIFRLVQESLTNVARHARGAPVWVSVLASGESIVVTVLNHASSSTNDAPKAARATYGLTGMQERVALFGGSLETGLQPGGGFEVRAVLPLGSAH